MALNGNIASKVRDMNSLYILNLRVILDHEWMVGCNDNLNFEIQDQNLTLCTI